MLYRRLADVVVVIHVLIAIFFFLGGIPAMDQPWIALLHLPLSIWVSAAYLMGWTCPLTPLENSLRRAAGERGYHGSFIDHYLGRTVASPSAPENPVLSRHGRWGQILVGGFFCLWTVIIYTAVVRENWDALSPSPVRPPAAAMASSAK
jgi:hypothetical protein